MIMCWNQRFDSVAHSWESPRCYVSTVHVLRKRLQQLPPEQAVMPEYFRFKNKRYKSIYALSFEFGDILCRSELYRRLGLIYNGRKVTVVQATCPKIWNQFKVLNRYGTFRTILN